MSFLRFSAAALVFAVAAAPVPSPATLTTTQLSEDHAGADCGSYAPVADAAGTITAYASDCNPTGGNADANSEIFRYTIGGARTQLTATTGCTSGRPTMSADGTRIAFESNCNLTGGNADANTEIFLWKSGTLTQLTTTTACDNLAPSMNGPGTYVAYDSNCITDGNVDGSVEIFRVSTTGTVKQLTSDATGLCDSTSASIDDSGSLVAYDSDCNPTGANEDFAVAIFTVTSEGVVTQKTPALTDACSSVRPSMDAAGAWIGFQSDCDFTGANADGGDEIFTVAAGGTIRQLTDSQLGAACVSGEPHMASGGTALTFSSYCPLGGKNADGSVEVFQASVGTGSSALLEVTSGTSCSSLASFVDASGSDVFFDSDCDPAGQNADGSVEAFRVRACVCGAPSTRKSPPKASDALYVLRAAVGSSTCALCDCDTDNNGHVSALDALRVLKVAVGQNIPLTCP